MRRSKSTDIFGLWAKDLLAESQGKIKIYPNGYEFSTEATHLKSGIKIEPRPTMDGRTARLSQIRSTPYCPQPPGDFPTFEDVLRKRIAHWVPINVCRKCPHHIPRRRGQPYPCCAVLITEATEKAKEHLNIPAYASWEYTKDYGKH